MEERTTQTDASDFRDKRMENAHYWAAQALGWLQDGPNAGIDGTYYVEIAAGTPTIVFDGDAFAHESKVNAGVDGLRDGGFPGPIRIRDLRERYGEVRLFLPPSDDRLPSNYNTDWRSFESQRAFSDSLRRDDR